MTELELLRREKADTRRVLCAALSETTYAAARRVVHRNLEMRVALKRLLGKLERRNQELDLALADTARDLQEILGR